MALLSVQKVTKATGGLTHTAAAAAGDTFPNDDQTFVHAVKSTVGTTTITITAVIDPVISPVAGSLTVPDVVITVPASGDTHFSVPQSHTSNGIVSMTYDSEVDLTLAVAKVGQ